MKHTPFVISVLCFALMTLPAMNCSAQTVRAGVASMITPVSTVRYYQQIIDYLGEKLSLSAEMIHRTTYDEIDMMLEHGEVDVAFICSMSYVLNKEKFGGELLVIPQVQGNTVYHSNIIVHKDSTIDSLDQLAGKTFAFVDPKSNTGRLYPVYLLAKRSITPEQFFSSFLYSYSHNKSIEMVAKKRADGASVDSLVYEFLVENNSPYTKQTKIIDRSPPFGMPPIVVPPSTPPFLKESMRSVFLEMHNDERGRQILEQMRIERFVTTTNNSYDSIRGMLSFVKNSQVQAGARDVSSTPSPSSSEGTVLFGVLPRDNPIIAYERYQPLVDHLSRVTGLPIELHLEKGYQEVVNSLGSGKLSFALLGPLTYLDAYKRFDTSPIARSRTARGETFFRSVIVTGPDGSIKELTELVDKRFAFASLWSTSGNLIPRLMLAWAGIHLDELGDYQHYNYHDTVAKKVISNEFDAGAIRLSTAERYLPFGLKVIASSDPIPTGPVVASSHTPYPIVRSVQQALLTINETAEGREILAHLDPDLQGGFVAASDTDYAEIRQLFNEIPNTCGRSCHPKLSF